MRPATLTKVLAVQRQSPRHHITGASEAEALPDAATVRPVGLFGWLGG